MAATKKTKKKYQNWTIFLLKEDYSTPDKYLSPSKNGLAPASHVVSISGAKSASLYMKQIAEKDPPWVAFFKGISTPVVSAKTRSASAVLVIETDLRTYAMTFGFGRSLLNSEAWEEEFGLKVVLNNVGDEGIKQIQLSAFDALLQNKQAQSVRSARIDEFGLDVEQDIIRSLTGIPADEELGRSIGGRDSLRVNTEVNIAQLPTLLDRIFADSCKTEYLKTFSWIGRMKEVREKKLRDFLDQEMLKKITTQDLQRMWIAPPTYQEWEAGRMFQIAKVEDLQDDLRLEEILESWQEIGELETVDIEALKSRKIVVVDDSEQEIEKWSVYKALYCEIDISTGTYLLNNGSWYKIDSSYLKEVNDSIDAFPKCSLALPDYNDDSEEAYNARVCSGDDQFCLMDQKFIELKARGYTKVEFCDIVSSSKELIHIKRYSGSSTLSHLFAQGIVPAELFLNVSEFRSKVNQKLIDSHKLADPNSPIEPKEYEVVYGIISKSENEIVLPFFSKVMLRNARTALENMNYKVSLCKIRNVHKSLNTPIEAELVET
jgi:uncharacterized protein (TIGR04141 family)